MLPSRLWRRSPAADQRVAAGPEPAPATAACGVPFDGLVTFYSSFHALRAESVLLRAGHAARLIPGPRDISPHCGTALQFRYEQNEAVAALLAIRRVQIEAIHHFRLGRLAEEFG